MNLRPTKRALGLAVGALVLFGVGTSVQAGWVLAIAALLAGFLIAGVLLPIRGLSGIAVARNVPARAVAGEPVSVTLTVANRGRGSRGLIRVSDDFCGRGAAVVTWLRPGEAREFVTQRSGTRRGVYEGGLAVVETGVPFGVARTRRRDHVGSTLVVHPKVYDVSRGIWEALSARRAPMVTDEASSVREYQPGDPLRSIHWRSVARKGHLVVREFDVHHRAGVTVAVSVPEDPDAADAVASIACSFAMSAQLDGSEVRLVSAHDGDVHVISARTSGQVLDWGARLAPARPGFAAVLDAARHARVETVVCVCGSDELPTDRLSALASGRSVFVITVGDEVQAASWADRGIRVASVAPSEVESWFESRSAVS